MFERYKDGSNMWRWRFRATNGKIMADSAEGYASKANLMRALDRYIELSGSTVMYSSMIKDGAPRFSDKKIKPRQRKAK
jgi:uncharacterized protein YegP (UPF0339 family)